jgi:hypothetical protein
VSEQFILTLRPEPHDVPVDVRLRNALKELLRRHRLRCVEARSVPLAPACAGVSSAGGGGDLCEPGTAAPVIPMKPMKLSRRSARQKAST